MTPLKREDLSFWELLPLPAFSLAGLRTCLLVLNSCTATHPDATFSLPPTLLLVREQQLQTVHLLFHFLTFGLSHALELCIVRG